MGTDKPSDHRHESANDVRCWDCGEHPTERLEEMFVDLIQRQRIERGQSPALRTVFLKQHGVAHGHLEPLEDLPEDMAVGLFAHGRRPCWVRFSSDAQPTDPDLHTTLGIGIKVFGIPGEKLLGAGDTADLILQNHDVFFVDDAQEFCEFTTAGVIDRNYPAYLAQHPKTKRVLDEMQKAEASCLTADYWAILPFRFGDDPRTGEPRYVKYRLEPVDQPAGEPFDQDDYLALDLARRLRAGEARFRLSVQFRTDPDSMPLDRATVRWDSPWIPVADLVLPRQDVCRRGQAEYGEHLAFNIWRVPPEQEPQGSIAAARRVVYQGSADQRRGANGISLDEPTDPRGPHAGRPSEEPRDARDDCIVSAAIHPPIGICRVGNSPKEWYLGPEVPDPEPHPPGFYRDGKGRLKREAARFRVYGLNALGEAVAELTADNAEIRWSVELANQKASWYQFQLALDIPEAADAPPSLRRNASVSDRASLEIRPGKRKISGRDKSGSKHAFDGGSFLGTEVYLGELRTDEAGRLIVLGGHGVSASHDGSRAVTYANNEGWHDDTADGPVKAKVTYDGVELAVEPAWVVVAPPNYGPLQKSVRTMWDLQRDVACSAGLLARPERPSFRRDLQPIFQRMHDLGWVNRGFAAAFGFGGPFDLSRPEWLARLADPTPANLELRRTIRNNFRHDATDGRSPVPWPWLYGDAMNVPPADTPRQNCSLSELQLWFLDRWVVGDFDADHDPDHVPPRCLDEVPVQDQPDTLTRAAMEFCLADAFHPGCEMTWPMRTPGMYSAPFRLKHRHKQHPEPSYGAQLDGDALSLPDGPTRGGQSPGSITRWMAVPWQTDTASCRSGYDRTYDPYLPTFWPARVPNEVLSEQAYAIVMDASRPLGERQQAFANRSEWLEPLGLDKSYTHQINHMIHHFGKLGVVEERPGLPDDPHFPDVMQVSDQRQDQPWKDDDVPDEGAAHTARRLTARREDPGEAADGTAPGARTDLSRIDKVRRLHRR